MNFSFGDDQNAIRELAARIFADRAGDEALLAFVRTGAAWDEGLWGVLGEQGLLGVAVPEAFGGSGLGLIELCLLLEEQGRRAAPAPLWASLACGGLPIAEFGADAAKERWLGALARGEAKLGAALPEPKPNPDARVTARAGKGGYTLNGKVEMIPDGAGADAILVFAADEAAESAFIVDASLPGVELSPLRVGMSGERAARLILNDAHVNEDAILGERGQGGAIAEWAIARANLAHCALQAGVCEAAMQRTAAYISEREQFGRPLGAFQALAMRMADSYIDVEAMRSTYWLALWRLSAGLEAAAEVRAAKWWACEGAHRVVGTAQHLHGGIGADVEYPIHRFYLAAKQIAYSLGNAGTQLEELGRLLAADDRLGFHALEV